MANSIIECERKIGGHVGLTERSQGALRDFRKIYLVMGLKHKPELGDRKGQQPHDRAQHVPLFFGIAGWRQNPNIMQCLA